MALTYPLDILTDWPGWTTDFDLLWRQEQSRQANGVVRVKDLGSPIWHMKASTNSISRRELDYWRARLDGLNGGMNTFIGRPLSRKWPIAYPGGTWPTGGSFDGTTATIKSVGTDGNSFAITGLPVGYQVSIGDMIMVAYGSPDNFALFRSMEALTANGSGDTAEFEVRPPGFAATMNVGDAVAVKSPYCLMTIVPGSITSSAEKNGRGTVSFEAIEAR